MPLSGCLPEEVEAYLNENIPSIIIEELERILKRPSIPAIFYALARNRNEIIDWQTICHCIINSYLFAKNYKGQIKPSRNDFEKNRMLAIKAGRIFQDAIINLNSDGADHSYDIPLDVSFFPIIIRNALLKMGHSKEKAEAAETLFMSDFSDFEDYLTEINCQQPFEFSDLLESLIQSLENLELDEGQSQGTARTTVFVRQLDYVFSKEGFCVKELLTDEQVADLTRAVMGRTDKLDRNGNRFSAANVRDARRSVKNRD